MRQSFGIFSQSINADRGWLKTWMLSITECLPRKKTAALLLLKEKWAPPIIILLLQMVQCLNELSVIKNINNVCLLPLVVNSGTTDLASRLGTNGLVNNKIVPESQQQKTMKCMENWNVMGFVVFICYICSAYSFRADWLFLFWLSLYFIVWKLAFYLVQWANWWFLIWQTSIACIVVGNHCVFNSTCQTISRLIAKQLDC